MLCGDLTCCGRQNTKPEALIEMEDIRLAIGLVGFVSLGVFLLTYRVLKSRSPRLLDAVAAFIVLLIALYVRTVWGQLWIVSWIPLPSVIILSNWFPPLLAALAAVVWLRLEPAHVNPDAGESADAAQWPSILRRSPVMLLMLGAAIYALMYFIPKEPPECKNQWAMPKPPLVWPVCRQTTPHTCSAASAATILYTLGIETTEQEMAQLCLTKSGTTWLGLYHGLSTKLLGTNFQVKFFEGNTAEIKTRSEQSPVLMCCELPPAVADREPRYQRDGGWIPGMAHSAVYFGPFEEYHIVGDPSRGYEFWTTEELETLWTGKALTIEVRPRVAVAP